MLNNNNGGTKMYKYTAIRSVKKEMTEVKVYEGEMPLYIKKREVMGRYAVDLYRTYENMLEDMEIIHGYKDVVWLNVSDNGTRKNGKSLFMRFRGQIRKWYEAKFTADGRMAKELIIATDGFVVIFGKDENDYYTYCSESNNGTENELPRTNKKAHSEPKSNEEVLPIKPIANTSNTLKFLDSNSVKLLEAPKKRTRLEVFEDMYPLLEQIGLAPDCKVVTIRKFKGRERLVHIDNRTIEGVAALLSKKFVVRIYVEDLENTVQDIYKAIRFVKERFPKHEHVTSSSNWVNQAKQSVDLLFAEVETAGKSEVNSRLASLQYHTKKGRSRDLGRARKFYIVRGDSSIKNYDGWMLLNPYKFNIPFDYIKVLGIENFSQDYVANPGITLKGIGEYPSKKDWNVFCNELGINPKEFDGVVPEVTIKFDNPMVDTVEVRLFSVFNPTVGRRATLSLQAMERMPLLPEAAKWCAENWAGKFNSMLDAFASNNALKIAGLLQESIHDLHHHLVEGDDESAVLEGTETMNSLMRRIVAGLPIDTSKVIKGILPFATRALKGIIVNGASETILPDHRLKPFEIGISRAIAKHLNLNVGDYVNVKRDPCTGIEIALCRIAYIGRTAINPEWWAERFNGDFDGDLVGIIPISVCGPIVDEAKFKASPVSTKKKGKAELTPAEATAKAIRSKALIPKIDSYLTVAHEKGLDPTPLRALLQAVIDSVKHNVDLDIAGTLAEVGISPKSQPSSLRQILSGRLGRSNRDGVLMMFNLHMERAHWNTRISWMTSLRKQCDFRYLVAGNGDPASVWHLLQKENPTKQLSGWSKRLLGAMEKALKSVGLEGSFNSNAQKEPHEYVELSAEMAERISVGIPATTPENAKAIARRLVKEYQMFIKNIGEGLNVEAYEHVKLMNDLVMEDEEIGGLALRYLTAALMVKGLDKDIKMRAMTILGYLPLTLGDYNIATILEKVGYVRKTNILLGCSLV